MAHVHLVGPFHGKLHSDAERWKGSSCILPLIAHRYLLYLSTPVLPASDGPAASLDRQPAAGEATAAQRALQPAVELLVNTRGLEPLQPSPGDTSGGMAGGGGTASAASVQPPTSAVDDSGSHDGRPCVLWAFYYSQCAAALPPAEQLPVNVVCPSPPTGPSDGGDDHGGGRGGDGGAWCTSACLVGHLSTVAAAEAAFRRAFPGRLWLSELALEDSGCGDDEAAALDSLEAALAQLADASSPQLPTAGAASGAVTAAAETLTAGGTVGGTAAATPQVLLSSSDTSTTAAMAAGAPPAADLALPRETIQAGNSGAASCKRMVGGSQHVGRAPEFVMTIGRVACPVRQSGR
eukprot:365011-Chlamydomonas_euryale.AAC.17